MLQRLEKIKNFLKRAKFKILLGILGLSILIIAVLGGYVAGQKRSVIEQSSQISPTELSQTPTVTPTPTTQGTTKATPTRSPQSASSPSPSQTPTPTPTAQAEISFSADKTTLARGQCSKLSWNVNNVSSASLVIGSGPPETVATGNQTKEVCPPFSKGFTNINGEDTVYILKVKKLDGSTEERKIVITVKQIEVRTTFNNLKVLKDADYAQYDFTGQGIAGKGEVQFKFKTLYNAGSWPKSGYISAGDGDQVDISNDTVRVDPMAVTDSYALEVNGFEDDKGTAQSLGSVNFTLPIPPGPAWNGAYTQTSNLANGQFEITFTVKVTMP